LKKEAKTFICCGFGLTWRTRLRAKVFWFFFSKRTLLLLWLGLSLLLRLSGLYSLRLLGALFLHRLVVPYRTAGGSAY
jgi:hypothetical protein